MRYTNEDISNHLMEFFNSLQNLCTNLSNKNLSAILTVVFVRVVVQVGLCDPLDFDSDAGLDLGELLVATLKPQSVKSHVHHNRSLKL